MDKRDEYFRLRALGFVASEAWRQANINVLFAELETKGAVRLDQVPDEPHDPSYVDTWGMSEGRANRVKAELCDRAFNDGTWLIVAQVRCPCCGAWKDVDHVGDFVGESWKDSGYDADLRREAIEEAWRLGVA